MSKKNSKDTIGSLPDKISSSTKPKDINKAQNGRPHLSDRTDTETISEKGPENTEENLLFSNSAGQLEIDKNSWKFNILIALNRIFIRHFERFFVIILLLSIFFTNFMF